MSEVTPSRAAVPWRFAVGAPLLIVAAVALAWSNSLSAPFVFDDHNAVLENQTIRDFSAMQWLRPPATQGETVGGRPVVNASLALNWAIAGEQVRVFRATNVAIHAMAALALFGLVRRTLVRFGSLAAARDANGLALVVALVWALHPVQTNAVTYVAQRAESLAGCFLLFSLYAFARAAGDRTRAWGAVSVVACFLALGSKESAAALPIIALLYDRTFVSGSFARAWRAHRGLHLGLASAWIMLIALVVTNAGRGGSAGFGADVGVGSYLLTQAVALTTYVRQTFWPARLVFDYGSPVATVGEALIPGALVLAALGFTLLRLRRNKVEGFLAATTFLVLAPSSSFVPIATQTVAEHRLYVALAPVLVLTLLGFRIVLGSGAASNRLAGILFAAVLALLTHARNETFGSETALWHDTAQKAPNNARAYNNLGSALLQRGFSDEAAKAFEQAIAAQPNHAFAHANLAAVRIGQERWNDALVHLQQAVAIDPGFGSARINLGYVLARLGRREEAAAEYRRVLQDDRTAVEAQVNLAALLMDGGAWGEAGELLQRAVQHEPPVPEAFFELGRWAERAGPPWTGRAEALYRRAVELRPDYVAAHVALGNWLLQNRELAGAEKAYRDALENTPSDAEAWFGLGNVLVRRRDMLEAARCYASALRSKPDHVRARANLANCQLATGEFDAAIANYEEVLRLQPNDAAVQQNLAVARELRVGRR